MIVETAPAKINLALHVRHRRPDGYHAIETLFAFCADGDELRVEPAAANRFAVTGAFAAALSGSPPGGNLVERAAAAFAASVGVAAAHAITLDKRLPVASGIGGGSADAAAVLRALARLHGIPVDDPRLVVVAADLGADVPACLLGRTSLGTGRGDDLRPVDGLPGMPVLLVNPLVAVSTAAVFAGWDGADRGAIPAGDLLARARAARNDLEPAARAVAPAIVAVRALLDSAPGALLSRMSGSGATCFALFADARDAAAAAQEAAARGWWTLQTTLTA